METGLSEVMEQVTLYLKEHLPGYTVLKVRKKSYHPDDSHLYMVSAKKDDGTYAVWTSWNQKTESLNHGHYGLQSEEACEKVMDEFYHSKDLVLREKCEKKCEKIQKNSHTKALVYEGF